MIGGVDASGKANLADIRNMDVETALWVVQCNRANLIEKQLGDQMVETQAHNNKIAQLNTLLGALNKTSAAFPGDAKSDSLILSTPNAAALCNEVRSAAVAAGINNLDTAGGDANGFGGSVSKGALDGKIQEIKSMIDSQSNTQQMSMLRLSSLNNKRNEAYDLLATTSKKFVDSKSSIISNMR